jgi:hypothetical protein
MQSIIWNEGQIMARHGLGGRTSSMTGPVLFIGLLFEAVCVCVGLFFLVVRRLWTGSWTAERG